MNRRGTLAALAGLAVLAVAVSKSWAEQPLQEIVEGFGRHATLAQQRQFAEALAASPALARQLTAAAEAGRLVAIDVVPAQSLPNKPFLATIDRGRILFVPDFLDRVATRRLSGIVQRDDILPNNLVFVLGCLVSQLQGPAVPPTTDMQIFIQANIARDARAFIQGWNDVVDAAERENGDRYLSAPQQLSLLENLRYRSVFLDRAGRRIVPWTSSGAIDPTDQIVATLVEALRHSNLLDFGVPPDLSVR
ncbi:hypothetical protein BH11PSE3_BH11PSE3_23920 [soil metagenome]